MSQAGTVICPKCGTRNTADAMNCKHCRINLKFALENPNQLRAAELADASAEQGNLFPHASANALDSAKQSDADAAKSAKQQSFRNYVLLFSTILSIVGFGVRIYANSVHTNFKRGPLDTSTGIVSKVTTAAGVSGNNNEPVNPATVFKSGQVIHAIVPIKNVPVGTVFAIEWDHVTVDQSNKYHFDKVYKEDYTGEGTRNLDFTLTRVLSPGNYAVSVFTGPSVETALNLEDLEDFTVQ